MLIRLQDITDTSLGTPCNIVMQEVLKRKEHGEGIEGGRRKERCSERRKRWRGVSTEGSGEKVQEETTDERATRKRMNTTVLGDVIAQRRKCHSAQRGS